MLTSTRRRATAMTALAGLALATTAACGSSSGGGGSTANLSPVAAFAKARAAIGKANAVTMTFKLDITAEQMLALDHSSGGHMTADQAAAVAGGNVVLAIKSAGGTLGSQASKGLGGGLVGLDVNAGGAPGLLQLRYLGKDLYVRADVAKYFQLTKADKSPLTSLTAHLPPALSFVKDAIAGKWIKLPIQDILKAIKSSGIIPQATKSASPDQFNALRQALSNIFDKDVTTTRVGPDPLGDHLQLTGSSRTLATDFVSAIKGSVSSIPGAGTAFSSFDATTIPDRQVTVDVFVKDGALSTIKLDITQFASAADKAQFGNKPLFVDLGIVRSATVAAPSGAVNVDIATLLGSLGSLFGGLGGTSSNSATLTATPAPVG